MKIRMKMITATGRVRHSRRRRRSESEAEDLRIARLQGLAGNRAASRNIAELRAGGATAAQIQRAPVTGKPTSTPSPPPAPDGSSHTSAKTEDLAIFKFVWKRIEAEVGHSASEEAVQTAFLRVARALQGHPLAGPALSTMTEHLSDIVTDFVAGLTVEQMAQRAGF